MNKEIESKKAFAIIGVTAFIVFCVCVPVTVLGLYLVRSASMVAPPPPYTMVPTTLPPSTQTSRLPSTQTATGLPPASFSLTPANVPEFGAAQYYFDAAYSYTLSENYAEAIPYWDQVLAEAPENGDAYYYRALCYLHVARGQHFKGDYDLQIAQALEDIDHAIAYGVTMGEPGDPYYLRYQVYEGVRGGSELATERKIIDQLSLDNLRAATVLGTTEGYSEQWIPMMLFALNRCEEGMDEIGLIKEYYGLSAPPSASMLNIEAQGYLCLNQLDKALEYVDRGLDIQVVPERLWLRANILYLMGRKSEALQELDRLIDAQPTFNGYRYFLRALIHYENGEREQAESDLATGSGNTWGRGGLRAYVMGLMALEDGDKETGIQYLQYSLATMEWIHKSLIPGIERKLDSLDAERLPDEPQMSALLQATPIPTFAPTPTPAVPVPVTSYGFLLPPNITPVDMAVGLGQIQITDDYPYQVFLFQPPEPVSIRSVQSMSVHLDPVSGTETKGFEMFLWELKTGEWILFKPDWGATAIENPERFVDSNGDVYLTIRADYDVTLRFEKIWVTITATGTDGSQIQLNIQ